MEVSLWEWNLNVVFVQNIVDDFPCLCQPTELLVNEQPTDDEEVNTAVAEIGEHDGQGMCRADNVASVRRLGADRLQGIKQQFPHFCDIRSIGYTHGNLVQFVLMIACQVLEILAEQSRVQEGDDRTVERGDERVLVGDAFHLARNAVTFYIITYAHTTTHQGDAVEEVFE